MLRCDQTAAWELLGEHFAIEGKKFDARTALAQGANRVQHFSQAAPHIFADLSKNRLDVATEILLLQMARECGLEQQRDAMLRGDEINTTEQRAVLHTILRAKQAIAVIDTAQSAI